jgi:ankyrin repeat protein
MRCGSAHAYLPRAAYELVNAARCGEIDNARRIIASGAELNVVHSIQETTALKIAVASGHREIADALIEADADVNRVDLYGATAIMAALASRYPRSEIVRVSLKAGANVEAMAPNGNSAL